MDRRSWLNPLIKASVNTGLTHPNNFFLSTPTARFLFLSHAEHRARRKFSARRRPRRMHKAATNLSDDTNPPTVPVRVVPLELLKCVLEDLPEAHFLHVQEQVGAQQLLVLPGLLKTLTHFQFHGRVDRFAACSSLERRRRRKSHEPPLKHRSVVPMPQNKLRQVGMHFATLTRPTAREKGLPTQLDKV